MLEERCNGRDRSALVKDEDVDAEYFLVET